MHHATHGLIVAMYPAACVDIHMELRQGVTTARMIELRRLHEERTGLPCDHPMPVLTTR